MVADESSVAAAKACIKKSLHLIAQNSNEQVIRESFTSYLRKVFPSDPPPGWIERHIQGSEHAVDVVRGARTGRGFVDNLVDLTPIEYEPNLTVHGNFERRRLRQLSSYAEYDAACRSLYGV